MAPGAPGPPGAALSPRCWAASISFHALLLGWLVFFSPVRVFDPDAKPDAAHVSADRAREVVEQIRDEQAASLEENLRALDNIRGKMAELEGRKRAEFAAFAAEMGKDAPAKAAAESQSIASLQAEVLAVLDKAGDSSTLFVQTRANAYFDDLAVAQKAAREKQARISQLQEESTAVLSLGDERFAAARSLQREASTAQDRAAKTLAEAEAARDAARGSRERTAREGQIEHFTYHLKRAKEAILDADANRATLNKEIPVAEAVASAASAAAEDAAANARAHPSDQARQAEEAAEKKAVRAERELAAVRKRLRDEPKKIEDAKKQLPQLEAEVAELLAQHEPTPVAPTAKDQKLISLQTTARQLQLDAGRAQEKAAHAIASIHDVGAPGSAAAAAALAALDQAAPSEQAPSLAGGEQTNLADAYESAVKTEEVLTQSYRRLRAAELAMIRHLPLTKAVQLTEVARVIRPDLRAGLQKSIESGDDVPAAREAVQTAKAEVGAMVRLAGSMLTEAQGLDKSQGSTISPADFDNKYEQWEKMQNLAAEDEGQWAKDLTGAMDGGNGKAGDGESGGEGAKGSSGDGTGSGGGGGTGGGSGKGGSGAQGGSGAPGPNLGKTGVAGPFGAGSGSGGSGFPGGPGGFGRGGIPGARGAVGAPEDVSARVVPFPGRRIAARGPSAKWIFADSWYILGPFDNTRRGNIDKKFPPETVIDLNATYPGKNGVPIRWEFHQSSKPNIMPPLDAYNAAVRNPQLGREANFRNNLQYIIYYAYTELHFEKACDLWVAIGSDDFAKVWIEDQLVWSSGKNLKAWKLNEGLRKVHFKQGINRVLYRVENGNDRTEFSLVISLQP